jgi:pyridoxine kinase
MSILSIQSHVSYGYVGNKAAVFPLQSLGYDVWAVNTVQFSNHTGYGSWTGQIFDSTHIQDVINGLKKLGVTDNCKAILSGYLGDVSIGEVIIKTVNEFRESNPNLIYLCDPVMGDVGRGFFVKEGILDFFKQSALSVATIITPNHFEAEALWGNKIQTIEDAKEACEYFHSRGVKIAIITSLNLKDKDPAKLNIFLSTEGSYLLANTPYLPFKISPNGTGDLFSALFLGYYLATRDYYKSLHNTLLTSYNVINQTYLANQRELKIIGNHYLNILINPAIFIDKLQ